MGIHKKKIFNINFNNNFVFYLFIFIKRDYISLPQFVAKSILLGENLETINEDYFSYLVSIIFEADTYNH
jgi:hypothetical protein